jgi:hypothetical protein
MFIRVMHGLSEWRTSSDVIARAILFFAKAIPDLNGDCFYGRAPSRNDIAKEEKWQLKI